MNGPVNHRATIVGTGLIGASIGLALRSRGWVVSGVDTTPGLVARAIELGACDTEGIDASCGLAVVATPVDAVVTEVKRVLELCPKAAVTDVGSVKSQIVFQISHERFVGGHPMAGSEQIGLDGAHGGLFEGAAWVLCPGPSTDDAIYELIRNIVTSFGAEALTMGAARHDGLVAVVSHVPHLTAAALVRVARARSLEHRALLRLAAGGFRDMTRIAAGSPAIWPGVCAQNRDAILETLDRLLSELGDIRSIVDEGNSEGLLALLGEAQQVRRNLPARAFAPEIRTEVRVMIPDRPGSVAAVAVLATDLGVNLASVSTIDVAETVGGVMVLTVAEADAELLRDGLVVAGFRAFIQNED